MNKNYSPPFLLKSGHISSLYPFLFRNIKPSHYERERIATPDGDFLDLDWSSVGRNDLIIFSHGLEGSSRSQYIVGMVKFFNNRGYDCLAWNYRGCGGTQNVKERAYHSGATMDLECVLSHVFKKHTNYESIYLVGFSLGGNLTAKYLGESGSNLSDKIKRAVIFSTPFSLLSSTKRISKGFSKIYQGNFLKTLKEKIKLKGNIYTDRNLVKALSARSLYDFDNYFTAPIHGFKDALDYYSSCSAKQFLAEIKIPTLAVNALNDPFLGEECYPHDEFKKNKNLTFLTPEYGGHVGFCSTYRHGDYWSEGVAEEFLFDL